jgi:hypothetical protein
VLVVEQELGERLGQLGLADAGRAQEHERADRPVRVLQAGARAAHGVGDGVTASSWPTTRLPDRPSMRSSFSRSPSSILSTGTPVQRETTWRSARRHLFLHQRAASPAVASSPRFGELLLELGDHRRRRARRRARGRRALRLLEFVARAWSSSP